MRPVELEDARARVVAQRVRELLRVQPRRRLEPHVRAAQRLGQSGERRRGQFARRVRAHAEARELGRIKRRV
jgi:hypothetical protein